MDELIAGLHPAGNYEVIWDGKNHTGEELSTGVYLVRLRYRLEGIDAWAQMVHRVMLVK